VLVVRNVLHSLLHLDVLEPLMQLHLIIIMLREDILTISTVQYPIVLIIIVHRNQHSKAGSIRRMLSSQAPILKGICHCSPMSKTVELSVKEHS
jgi:hypothetical protein